MLKIQQLLSSQSAILRSALESQRKFSHLMICPWKEKIFIAFHYSCFSPKFLKYWNATMQQLISLAPCHSLLLICNQDNVMAQSLNANMQNQQWVFTESYLPSLLRGQIHAHDRRDQNTWLEFQQRFPSPKTIKSIFSIFNFFGHWKAEYHIQWTILENVGSNELCRSYYWSDWKGKGLSALWPLFSIFLWFFWDKIKGL